MFYLGSKGNSETSRHKTARWKNDALEFDCSAHYVIRDDNGAHHVDGKPIERPSTEQIFTYEKVDWCTVQDATFKKPTPPFSNDI